MRLTYYGQSCFLLETGGKRILFDPFISGNTLAAHVDVPAIRCDYIFVSHAHSDHTADLETIGTALTAASPEESAKAARFLQTKLAALPSRTAAAALAGDLNAHFGDILTPLNNDEVVPETRELPSLNLQLMPGLLDLEIAQIELTLQVMQAVTPPTEATAASAPAAIEKAPSTRERRQPVRRPRVPTFA